MWRAGVSHSGPEYAAILILLLGILATARQLLLISDSEVVLISSVYVFILRDILIAPTDSLYPYLLSLSSGFVRGRRSLDHKRLVEEALVKVNFELMIESAEREEDFVGGGDFVVISVISGAIIGVGYIINGLISRLVCVFLTSRAYLIVAILFFDLSIVSCYISENSDSIEKIADLAKKEERKRRRLAGGKEAFILIIMIIYSAG